MTSTKLTVFTASALLISSCVSVNEPVAEKSASLQPSRYGKAHQMAPKELQQFGRFTGRWECLMSDHRADGTWRPRPVRISWTWFYTLSGMAVQDIWTSAASAGAQEVIATNLRLYDKNTSQWNVSWTNTQQSTFELWSGSQEDSEMVMYSEREGRSVRIRFFEILPRRFQWIYEAGAGRKPTSYTPVLKMQCQRPD